MAGNILGLCKTEVIRKMSEEFAVSKTKIYLQKNY